MTKDVDLSTLIPAVYVYFASLTLVIYGSINEAVIPDLVSGCNERRVSGIQASTVPTHKLWGKFPEQRQDTDHSPA